MSAEQPDFENVSVPTDVKLLQSFLERQDREALETLVQKHSTLMMSVCFHILRNQDAAEDAFQNAVVVFVQKANTIRQPQYLSNWLYRVAQHEAFSILRRQKREQTSQPMLEQDVKTSLGESNPKQFEELALLHEELDQLSDKVRGPLVLCYLEGKSRQEAARELNVTPNSIKASLVSGRKQLRARLLKRGVAMASVIAAWNATQTQVSATVTNSLVQQAVTGGLAQTLTSTAGTTSLSSSITGSKGLLTKGTMWMAVSGGKKGIVAGIALLALIGGGVVVGLRPGEEETNEKTEVQTPKEEFADIKPVTVPMGKTYVKVLDVDTGRTIAGAALKVSYLNNENGSSAQWSKEGWGRSDPPTWQTDPNGRAEISYPKFTDPTLRKSITRIVLKVIHDDFADSYDSAVDLTNRSGLDHEIKLEQGVAMQVVPRGLPPEMMLEDVYVHCSTNTGDLLQTPVKITPENTLALPRLRANQELLRLAWLPSQGKAWFSDPVELDLTQGGDRTIDVPLYPAVSVKGKLSENVPRPVNNGIVTATLVDYYEKDKSQYNKQALLFWQEWAEVNPDGTFEFFDLPAGKIQLVSRSDGYYARSGEDPGFFGKTESRPYPRPQAFEAIDPVTEVELQMEQTGKVGLTVVDTTGKPVPHLKFYSSPNVSVWRAGNMIYGFPLNSTKQHFQEAIPIKWSLENHPYMGETDEKGQTVIRNLPPGKRGCSLIDEKWELAIQPGKTKRDWRYQFDIVAGERTEAEIVVELKPVQE